MDEAQDYHNYVQFFTERGDMATLAEMSDVSIAPQATIWNGSALTDTHA